MVNSVVLREQKGIWNWVWFDSEEFDDLHYAALKEVDAKKRESMYFDMQKVMESLDSFIMHPPSVLLYRDTIKPGLYPNGGLKSTIPASWLALMKAGP